MSKAVKLEPEFKSRGEEATVCLSFVQRNEPGDRVKMGSSLFAAAAEEDESSKRATITMLLLCHHRPKLCFHLQESKKTPENNRGRRQGATVPGTQCFVRAYVRAHACTHYIHLSDSGTTFCSTSSVPNYTNLIPWLILRLRHQKPPRIAARNGRGQTL